MLRFRAVIKRRGINPYIYVGSARATAIQRGWRKPLTVLVRINGKPHTPRRINLMPAGDESFYLYLHDSLRKASESKVGDRVVVDVAFDSAYRGGPMHSMPRWFTAALTDNPKAKKAWRALIPSRKKEILRYFSSLKSAASRARNLSRALEVLLGTEARFMARTWKHGE